MSDKVDHHALYLTAESQAGYFTTQQALAAGMDRSTLSHHARPGGRYLRVRRGLFRLRDFPTNIHEHVVAAWLGVDNVDAVVSHESALALFGLADVIPDTVHISLPRSKRGQRPRPGVRFHTSNHHPDQAEIRSTLGVPVTTPDRSIVDSLEAGSQPEQIEMAIHQAISRGLTTPRRIQAAAESRSARVRRFVDHALEGVAE